MKKLRDFKCDTCGHKAERLVEDYVTNIPCGQCESGVQVRQLAAPAGSGNAAHGFMSRKSV